VVTRRIEKSNWRSVCDQISRMGRVEDKYAEIEIAGVHLGDHTMEKWLPLTEISYSSRDDAVEISLKSLHHRIRHPSDISIEESGDALLSICVTDRERFQHVVRLSKPLNYPVKAA
jgi:hypothetical protein